MNDTKKKLKKQIQGVTKELNEVISIIKELETKGKDNWTQEESIKYNNAFKRKRVLSSVVRKAQIVYVGI